MSPEELLAKSQFFHVTFLTNLSEKKKLTLSMMVTSAPLFSSAFITFMCLCSAAQMIGVQPPLS